jgi:glyoxylase-like metal-dependent hydrolase (beta-lactamase superfamily II)
MKRTDVTENLIQVSKWGFMNAYLVREDDGFTLVDTMMGAADPIIEAAAAAGRPIKRIVLTHGHADHVGSLDKLHEKLGAEVPVMITETDAGILAGAAVAPPAEKRGGWPKLTTKLDNFIKPGDRIGSLEVIASPGHTPGHVAFLDTRDRSLIAGDTFSSIGGLAVPSHPHLRFPLPYLATCDRTLVIDSAEQLTALNPTALVLGHGKALRDPQAKMTAAVADARRRAR